MWSSFEDCRASFMSSVSRHVCAAHGDDSYPIMYRNICGLGCVHEYPSTASPIHSAKVPAGCGFHGAALNLQISAALELAGCIGEGRRSSEDKCGAGAGLIGGSGGQWESSVRGVEGSCINSCRGGKRQDAGSRRDCFGLEKFFDHSLQNVLNSWEFEDPVGATQTDTLNSAVARPKQLLPFSPKLWTFGLGLTRRRVTTAAFFRVPLFSAVI
ncbi:hypothetical protein WMY93_004446 [Mugilogobius chulae]|uniref:Uncharacterized protein n=1 Tax=Mugilogobius chulae TaxID=88201 RepID=A0AAW0PNJ7_9GOBI